MKTNTFPARRGLRGTSLRRDPQTDDQRAQGDCKWISLAMNKAVALTKADVPRHYGFRDM